jgi:methylmalonyl-CoA mutase
MRSLATRDTGSELSAAIGDAIAACRAAGYDLVMVETAGIGQGDAAIVPHVDASLYVMTPEFGAASQLEKIDMLDFADFVAITSSTGAAPRTRCATCASRCSATRRRFARRPRKCRCSAPLPARSNDDG